MTKNKIRYLQKKILTHLNKINFYNILNFDFLVNTNIHPFIVGGFIRDIHLNLNRKKIDLDLVLLVQDSLENYKKYITNLCKKCQYKVVELDNKNLVYRAVVNENLYIDFTYTFDLYKDFHRRDYTVNSIYFDVIQKKIIDFDNCLDDLFNKKLKAINFQNLIFDPIRMIRAIRIKNEFLLSIDNHTSKFIKENFSHITKTNPVRLKQELMKIFNLDLSHKVIQDLIEYGFFQAYGLEINDPSELIQILKVLDLTYFLYYDILAIEYEFILKEKNYYIFLLLAAYFIKNDRNNNFWSLSLVFGENIIQKVKKIINDWNKRQDPKFVINSFKHKNSHQIFELLYINLLLNINKLDSQHFIDTMEIIFKVCRYVCETKENIIPFDKYVEIYKEKNYDKYIDYIISTLA